MANNEDTTKQDNLSDEQLAEVSGGDGGIVNNRNILWGDYFTVDPGTQTSSTDGASLTDTESSGDTRK